jgi:creatinine amidohydrolase
MNLENHNWMQIESYLKQDDRIILVLGACEQHGYLSLLTDVKIPLALAEAVSKETGVLVAPPLNFGCSPYFLDYPGTISLRLQTYLNVVEDIIRSLYGYGFRRILILNGHGGNTPAKTHLVEVANQLHDLRMVWYAWWTTKTVADIADKNELDLKHASWLEAFEMTRLVDLPGEKKPLPASKSSSILNHIDMRQTMGDGSFGGDYQVDDAIMQEIFEACADEIQALLKFER